MRRGAEEIWIVFWVGLVDYKLRSNYGNGSLIYGSGSDFYGNVARATMIRM